MLETIIHEDLPDFTKPMYMKCIKRMPCGLCEMKSELCSYEYYVPINEGEWLTDPLDSDRQVCSVCGRRTIRKIHYNEGVYGGYDKVFDYEYCPHCGAKLKPIKEKERK